MIEFDKDLLRQLMKEKGINGSQLAKMTGVTRASVSRILKGTRKKPEPQFILGLTKIFERPMEDFFIPKVSLKSDTEPGATSENLPDTKTTKTAA